MFNLMKNKLINVENRKTVHEVVSDVFMILLIDGPWSAGSVRSRRLPRALDGR